MKSLQDLIDQCGDRPVPYPTKSGRTDYQEGFNDGDEAGHRACFDKLAPALREAVRALGMKGMHSMACQIGEISFECYACGVRDKIRALLEAK